jgi:hypothetical protein
MKNVLKIVLANASLFFLLIFIHEISHAAVGAYFGCRQIGLVVFDLIEGPKAEMSCSNGANPMIFLSGTLITLIFGGIFLLFKSFRSASFLAFGFALIFGAIDMSTLLNIIPAFYISALSGAGIMIFGEYKVAMNFVGI